MEIIDDIKVYYYPEDTYLPLKYDILKGKNSYLDIFGCFDIETTLLEKQSSGGQDEEPDYFSIMYIWQYTDSIDRCYVGRTWTSYQKFLADLEQTYNLSSTQRMACYVHNLQFEFQYIRSVVNVKELFATAMRRVVKFTCEYGVEFRCSHILTNMGLAKFCESENTGYHKQTGFDYDKKRYPDTPLPKKDLKYSIYDVVALHASLEHLMETEGDTIKTIPLTSTGYVRREAREKTLDKDIRNLLYRTKLDSYKYKFCKAATRGGNTHANYYYTGALLHDVYSYDRSSSYPHVMVTGTTYPISKYIVEKRCNYLTELPKGLSCIATVEFINLRLKPSAYIPYLPYSRAIAYQKPKWNDNGRVIQCEHFVITVTEIDYEIIESQYTWDKVIFHELMVADKGRLPKKYREFIMEMYIRKSELKKADPYFYMKSKNKLNSTFGMMLTDVTREEIEYSHDRWLDGIMGDVDDQLKKYYNNPKSFLVYQHGLYVTALARKELQRSIDICGIDTVYVDTDSNKHINDHSKDFANLNKEIHEENMKNDIIPIVTVDGKTYEMGIWEDEGDGLPEYSEFVTMGAKKYAYKYTKSGKYGVTVAGLSKQKGAELVTKVGLENFTTGLIFDPSYSGRLTAKYDDDVRIEVMDIDGHRCEVTSSVSLVPTSYTLGLEKNYASLINIVQQGGF